MRNERSGIRLIALLGVLALALLGSFVLRTVEPDPPDAALLAFENASVQRFSKLSFVTPIATVAANTDPAGALIPENSSSGFIVAYRGRIFLVTAAHVLVGVIPGSGIYFNTGNDWIRTDTPLHISPVLDLAAIDVTGQVPDAGRAAVIKTETAAMRHRQTTLVVPCNPYVFAIPFVGQYEAHMTLGAGDLVRTLLEINFVGTAVRNRCSGSPVVDAKKQVRGVLIMASVRADQNGVTSAYAVPALVLALFLEEKFFRQQ